MNNKNNMAVLFLHHTKSDITIHNYNLLKKFNPDLNIFPVGFEWHDLMEGSHIVRRSDELPNNSILEKILSNGKSTSSESDLYIYDFFLHHQDFDSYFVVEWDTYCNASIEECYGEAFKTMEQFSAFKFTNELDNPEIKARGEGKNVKEWSWYRYFFSQLNESGEQKKLMPYLGGTYPTSLLYYNKKSLYNIVNLVLDNPRLYDNIQNEMRLGTLLQQAGYKLNEFGGYTNTFNEQKHYKTDIANNVKGYYHPIKEIL